MSIRIPQVQVIGTAISACDFNAAVACVVEAQQSAQGGYVCFVNAHTSVEARRNPEFKKVLDESLLNLADGKPVHWVASRSGYATVGHLPGPDFMIDFMRRFPGSRHFLYGSRPEILERLEAALGAMIPGLNICGRISPPFRALAAAERQAYLQQLRDTGAEFIWVGLGAPRQEVLMMELAPEVPKAVLFGVGAAFDFHAGAVARAPALLRSNGLEWLYRLVNEPKRLWKRYLVTNSLFVFFAARDFVTK